MNDASAPRSATLRLQLVAVRFLSLLVPASHRGRWCAEWRAELWYADRLGRTRLSRILPALPHAAALRWQESSPDMIALDVRQAFRQLLHAPLFSALVVLTLGVGIGATTLVYSILQTTVLQPLGNLDSEGLVYLWRVHESGSMRVSASLEDLAVWEEAAEGLEEVHALAMGIRLYSGSVEPMRVPTGQVLPGFFGFLGVQPELGRTFAADEGVEGADQVVVLSHALWNTAFGAAKSVVGSTVLVDDAPRTVIGVLPADFRLQAPHHDLAAWVPLIPASDPRGVIAIARLAPGSTVDQVNEQLAALPVADARMEDWKGGAETPQSRVSGRFRRVVWSLQGAVVLVLLIAGANTANLLLARGTHRRRELAVRSAIGAGRSRLVRQLLAESLFLSVAGAVVGIGLARLGLTIVDLVRPADLRFFESLRIEPSLLAVAAGLGVACGVLFGIVPAFQSSSGGLAEGLADGARGSSDGPRGGRLRGALVVAEVALSTLLVVGAGLLVGSFLQLLGTDPGFDPDDVLVARVSLPETRYEDAAAKAEYWERLERELRTALGPRAESVGITTGVPPRVGVNFGTPELGSGADPAEPEALQQVNAYLQFTPAAFGVLGISFLAGGPEIGTGVEGEDLPLAINRTLALRLWGRVDVVGERFRLGGDSWFRVTGVTEDIKAYGLVAEAGDQQMYEVLGGSEWYDSNFVVVRGTDPLELAGTVRAVATTLEADAVVTDVALAREMLGQSVALQRFNAQLMVAFASLALGLALVGIYAVLSYSVSRRVPELGVRMALGASPGSVLRLVGREGMLLIGVGLLVGLGAATFASRLLVSQLHGFEPVDPLTYIAAALVLVSVGLAACALPAVRATRVDPIVALRAD